MKNQSAFGEVRGKSRVTPLPGYDVGHSLGELTSLIAGGND